MTVVAGIEAVALVAVVLLFLRHTAQQAAAATLERRELITRIQHPERVPTGTPDTFELPETEPDDIGLVGQIIYQDAEE